MPDLAIYDANVVIDWLKVREREDRPRPLLEHYEYAALHEGKVRLVISARWIGDARGGFAGATDRDREKLGVPLEVVPPTAPGDPGPPGLSPRGFRSFIDTLITRFGVSSQLLERRIAEERIAFSVPEDPRDNHLAEMAIAGRVRYLVTKDHHLLALRFHPLFLAQAPDTLILTPRQFAELHPVQDVQLQRNKYCNLVRRYLEKRERGMWVDRGDRKVRLTRPSKLLETPIEHLRRIVHLRLGRSAPDEGFKVQYRKRRRGPGGDGHGGDGGTSGGGSPPSGPGPQSGPRKGKHRMLSIQPISAGGDYHAYLKSEYYLGEALAGRWLGEGARTLGLAGDVEPAAFAALHDGYAPDGRPLVQNAGRREGKNPREPGWDLTFSAPKAVSVLWAVAAPEVRDRLASCHAEAVAQALGYLESDAAWSRQKVPGSPSPVPVQAKLAIAAYDHGASRELDPQLHTHCVVFNLGLRADGTWGALQTRPNRLYRHKMAAGALYRAALANGLAGLGLELTARGHGFSIAGLPEPLLAEFSKRRRQIEKELAGRSAPSAAVSAAAALTTRRSKQPTSGQDLLGLWRQVAEGFGFTPEKAANLLGRNRAEKTREAASLAVEQTAAELLEKDAYFPAKALVRATAHALQDGSATAREIRDAVKAWLARPNVVPLGTKGGEQQFTTKGVVERERCLLADAAHLAAREKHAVSRRAVGKALKSFPERCSSPEEAERNRGQREAIEHLTGPQALALLSGRAGSGKTAALRACRQVWEKSGYTVTGAALSGVAAKNLQKESGIESETLAMRLKQLEGKGLLGTIVHHAAQVAKTAANEVHRDINLPIHRPYRLSRKTVVVLDEAAMVPTRELARLIRAVRDAGAKLVAVGDALQLQPIGAGSPFPRLEKEVGAAKLTLSTRQKLDLDDRLPGWKRVAGRHFAEGRAEKALALYAERGLLSVELGRDQARKKLVADWAASGGVERPAANLILAGTNADVRALNALCQAERLRKAGNARNPMAVDVGGEVVHEGDRVLFGKKSRTLGVENGNLGTVERLAGLGSSKALTVKLDDGTAVKFSPGDYADLRLGYALTTHKAQGATVENAYVLLGGATQDRHLSYVQATRATESTRFYADLFEAGPGLSGLARSMSQSRRKDMAHDILEPRVQVDRRTERASSLEQLGGNA